MKKYSFFVLDDKSRTRYLNISEHFTDKIFLAAGLVRQTEFDTEEEAVIYWTKLRQGFLDYKKRSMKDSEKTFYDNSIFIGEEVGDEVMILPYYKFK